MFRSPVLLFCFCLVLVAKVSARTPFKSVPFVPSFQLRGGDDGTDDDKNAPSKEKGRRRKKVKKKVKKKSNKSQTNGPDKSVAGNKVKGVPRPETPSDGGIVAKKDRKIKKKKIKKHRKKIKKIRKKHESPESSITKPIHDEKEEDASDSAGMKLDATEAEDAQKIEETSVSKSTKKMKKKKKHKVKRRKTRKHQEHTTVDKGQDHDMVGETERKTVQGDIEKEEDVDSINAYEIVEEASNLIESEVELPGDDTLDQSETIESLDNDVIVTEESFAEQSVIEDESKTSTTTDKVQDEGSFDADKSLTDHISEDLDENEEPSETLADSDAIVVNDEDVVTDQQIDISSIDENTSLSSAENASDEIVLDDNSNTNTGDKNISETLEGEQSEEEESISIIEDVEDGANDMQSDDTAGGVNGSLADADADEGDQVVKDVETADIDEMPRDVDMEEEDESTASDGGDNSDTEDEDEDDDDDDDDDDDEDEDDDGDANHNVPKIEEEHESSEVDTEEDAENIEDESDKNSESDTPTSDDDNVKDDELQKVEPGENQNVAIGEDSFVLLDPTQAPNDSSTEAENHGEDIKMNGAEADADGVGQLEEEQVAFEENEESSVDLDEAEESAIAEEEEKEEEEELPKDELDSGEVTKNMLDSEPFEDIDIQALDISQDDETDITVSVSTWNLAELAPSEEEASFIRRFRNTVLSSSRSNRKNRKADKGSDIVLISGQECENVKPRRAEGHRSRELRRLMIKHLGKAYVPLAIHSFGGIQFGLFCKRSILGDVEAVRIADVACGIGNVFHNKGGIAAFLKMKARKSANKATNRKGTRAKSVRMLFVTAHLAAHVKNVEARNMDFWRIVSELEAQAPPAILQPNANSDEEGDTGGSYLLESMDRIFFCGDLNYRVDLPREIAEFSVSEMESSSDAEKIRMELLRHDQLLRSVAEGAAFPGFAEGKISFPPTFKFDKGTMNYDTSHKQRVPAWTDRVLYKPNGVRVLEYQSVPEATHSDHRPVFATFRVSMLGRLLPPQKRRVRKKSSEAKNKDKLE